MRLQRLLHEAETLVDEGELSPAMEKCENALKTDPQSEEAYSNKGYILKEQENYAQAIECYDNAIQIIPKRYFILSQRRDSPEARRTLRSHRMLRHGYRN